MLYGKRIVAVFGGASAIAAEAEVVIDGQGATLLPGLIDSRVHLSEPGLEYRETVSETAQLAAQGGIATIIAQPDTAPPAPTDRRRCLPSRTAAARRGSAHTDAGEPDDRTARASSWLNWVCWPRRGLWDFPTGSGRSNGWRRYRAP